MDAISGLDLAAGEYRIRPSEWLQNWDGRLRSILSGNLGSLEADEFHIATIEKDGERVLEVVQDREKTSIGFIISIPVYQNVFLFRTPGGEPLFKTTGSPIQGFKASYTVENVATGETIAAMKRGGLVSQRWKLLDADNTVQASTDRKGGIRNLFSFSTEYTVSAPDGNTIAEFEHSRASGGLKNKLLAEMDVSCVESDLPTEFVLALAFVTLQAIKQKQRRTGGSGAD